MSTMSFISILIVYNLFPMIPDLMKLVIRDNNGLCVCVCAGVPWMPRPL